MKRDCSIEARYDEDGVQVTSAHDERGHELPDPVPMAPPIGTHQGASLVETIQRMFQQEAFRARAAAEGFDTMEEADDFDIEDDPLDPLTVYERHFYPDPEAPPPAPVPEPPAPAAADGGERPESAAGGSASGPKASPEPLSGAKSP